MSRLEELQKLNRLLLEDMPEYKTLVREYRDNGGACNVIFNVFGDKDRVIYDRLLKWGD